MFQNQNSKFILIIVILLLIFIIFIFLFIIFFILKTNKQENESYLEMESFDAENRYVDNKNISDDEIITLPKEDNINEEQDKEIFKIDIENERTLINDNKYYESIDAVENLLFIFYIIPNKLNILKLYILDKMSSNFNISISIARNLYQHFIIIYQIFYNIYNYSKGEYIDAFYYLFDKMKIDEFILDKLQIEQEYDISYITSQYKITVPKDTYLKNKNNPELNKYIIKYRLNFQETENKKTNFILDYVYNRKKIYRTMTTHRMKKYKYNKDCNLFLLSEKEILIVGIAKVLDNKYYHRDMLIANENKDLEYISKDKDIINTEYVMPITDNIQLIYSETILLQLLNRSLQIETKIILKYKQSENTSNNTELGYFTNIDLIDEDIQI